MTRDTHPIDLDRLPEWLDANAEITLDREQRTGYGQDQPATGHSVVPAPSNDMHGLIIEILTFDAFRKGLEAFPSLVDDRLVTQAERFVTLSIGSR